MKKLLFVSLVFLGAAQLDAAISDCYSQCQAQNARLARSGSQVVVNCAAACGDLPSTSQVVGSGCKSGEVLVCSGAVSQGGQQQCMCASIGNKFAR